MIEDIHFMSSTRFELILIFQCILILETQQIHRHQRFRTEKDSALLRLAFTHPSPNWISDGSKRLEWTALCDWQKLSSQSARVPALDPRVEPKTRPEERCDFRG